MYCIDTGIFAEWSNRDMFMHVGLNYDVKSPSELKGEFDIAVDCSGFGPAMEAAVPLLGPGGRLCIFGVAHPQAKLTIEPFQVIDDITSLNTDVSLLISLLNEFHFVGRFIRRN